MIRAARSAGTRRLAVAFLLYGLLGILVILPLSRVLLVALGLGSGKPWFDTVLTTSLYNSVQLALLVGLVALLIGVPLGFLTSRTDLPGASLWAALATVPFMIPPYMGALSWMVFMQKRGYLEQIAGPGVGWLQDQFLSLSGMVLVMSLHLFPIVFFAARATFDALGGSLEAAGRVSGAGPWLVFRRITLPLAAPAIAGAAMLVFVMAIEEYGTPAIFGPHIGYPVMVTAIKAKVASWPLDLIGAARISLVLTAVAVLAWWTQTRITARRDTAVITGRAADTERVALGIWRWPLTGAVALIYVLAIGVPVFSAGATSVLRLWGEGLSLSNLTLDHYRHLFTPGTGAWQALSVSLRLAAVTATMGAVLGMMISYAVVRRSVPGARWLDLIANLPGFTASIVMAVGLILAWNHRGLPFTIYGTGMIIVAAHLAFYLGYALRYQVAALKQIRPSLEEAALVSGAGPLLTFRRVLLPMLAPAIWGAWALTFIIASRELVAATILRPASVTLASVYIFGQFEQGSPAAGMAMAVVMMALSFTILLVLRRWIPLGR